MSAANTPMRAENVGSLLRPAQLKAAVDGHASADERGAIEDACIAEAVQRQIDCGLDVVTDGEMRRSMFLNSFWDAVTGYSTDANPVTFRGDDGSTVTWNVQRIEDRLRPIASPAADEARFLADCTDHPFKVTFPAASLFALPFTFKPGINDHAYTDLDELVQHCISIEEAAVADAIAAGATFVQFDFPAYPYLADPTWVDAMADIGWSTTDVLELAIAADNAVRADIPDHVTVGMHVCRGNNQSRYLCEGSLEPVADAMFGRLDYDVLLVEWEDQRRMGDFSPLRHLPDDGPLVVLGIISSKVATADSSDDIRRLIDDAAAHAPLDRLALSTQCGFASTWAGNAVTEDDQWRKLALVASVAQEVWG